MSIFERTKYAYSLNFQSKYSYTIFATYEMQVNFEMVSTMYCRHYEVQIGLHMHSDTSEFIEDKH